MLNRFPNKSILATSASNWTDRNKKEYSSHNSKYFFVCVSKIEFPDKHDHVFSTFCKPVPTIDIMQIVTLDNK